jgi:ABC-type glycerol-3-phosphate transport system permease component
VAFTKFGIPLYGAEMLSTGLICFLEVWNTFDRVGIPV